jgi:hypothetical protein
VTLASGPAGAATRASDFLAEVVEGGSVDDGSELLRESAASVCDRLGGVLLRDGCESLVCGALDAGARDADALSVADGAGLRDAATSPDAPAATGSQRAVIGASLRQTRCLPAVS